MVTCPVDGREQANGDVPPGVTEMGRALGEQGLQRPAGLGGYATIPPTIVPRAGLSQACGPRRPGSRPARSRCHLGPLRFGATTGIGIGITYGLVYVITFAVGYRSSGLATPAFMTFMIARTWLALQRKLPWALMPYLEDAH